ncbi:hypothetical protein [Williamsia sp.]|uniref:AlbA family DNA-binding domain-containing protein n=1 Tax=Williamsia sp. TaxID=1872085 RepID=UPI001A334E62|nr:hypothetical protein [Williamsia sp.]MBJ7287574.1 ATP-binding protein [Williamsia sp.]
MANPDFTHLPRGQMGWTTLIEHLVATDDRAERHFLELKSDIELTQKSGRVKVAKFILGASNRDPAVAAPWLDGHAIMVLGIAPNAVVGVQPFEMHQLADAVRAAIGDNGPHWDVQRVQLDGKDVVVIVVAPPEPTVIATCHSDGADGLVDGDIYIRTDGATRRAKGGEIRALIARTRKTPLDASIAVTGDGDALHCGYDDAALTMYVDRTAAQLRRALPDASAQTSYRGMAGSNIFTPANIAALSQEPDPRSRDEYLGEVAEWATAAKNAIPDVIEHILACWQPFRLRIANLNDTFLEGVRVSVRFNEPVIAHRAQGSVSNAAKLIPTPPRAYGPRPFSIPIPNYAITKRPEAARIPVLPPTPGGLRINGPAELAISLNELRPRDVVTSPNGEVVLLVPRDCDATAITGTWSATARDHHGVYEGTIDGIAVCDAAWINRAIHGVVRALH